MINVLWNTLEETYLNIRYYKYDETCMESSWRLKYVVVSQVVKKSVQVYVDIYIYICR